MNVDQSGQEKAVMYLQSSHIMLASAWLPSPDYSLFPVDSTMDWYVLLFSLFFTCLVGISSLFLFVARKHNTPNRLTNLAEVPAWQFRTQETFSLLAWVRRLYTADNIQAADYL
jgi:hypothetical protein